MVYGTYVPYMCRQLGACNKENREKSCPYNTSTFPDTFLKPKVAIIYITGLSTVPVVSASIFAKEVFLDLDDRHFHSFFGNYGSIANRDFRFENRIVQSVQGRRHPYQKNL
uniref:Uncharacterized protein n=1 Tax=Glossina austeni TaxID=7395 RepID=A0A1A9UF56_GLOAU